MYDDEKENEAEEDGKTAAKNGAVEDVITFFLQFFVAGGVESVDGETEEVYVFEEFEGAHICLKLGFSSWIIIIKNLIL